jgi:hypothetical protein
MSKHKVGENKKSYEPKFCTGYDILVPADVVNIVIEIDTAVKELTSESSRWATSVEIADTLVTHMDDLDTRYWLDQYISYCNCEVWNKIYNLDTDSRSAEKKADAVSGLFLAKFK